MYSVGRLVITLTSASPGRHLVNGQEQLL
jgi:hypothetical protein